MRFDEPAAPICVWVTGSTYTDVGLVIERNWGREQPQAADEQNVDRDFRGRQCAPAREETVVHSRQPQTRCFVRNRVAG
jgi:hypothetical protein